MFIKDILKRIKNYHNFTFQRFNGTLFKIRDRHEAEYFIFKINFHKKVIEEYIPSIEDKIDLIEERDLASYLPSIDRTVIVMITENQYFDSYNIKSIIETSHHIYGLDDVVVFLSFVNGYKIYKASNDIEVYFDMYTNQYFGYQNKLNKYIVHKIFNVDDKRNKQFSQNIKEMLTF